MATQQQNRNIETMGISELEDRKGIVRSDKHLVLTTIDALYEELLTLEQESDCQKSDCKKAIAKEREIYAQKDKLIDILIELDEINGCLIAKSNCCLDSTFDSLGATLTDIRRNTEKYVSFLIF